MGRGLRKTSGEVFTGYTIVVEKSTLPVRTAEVIQEILSASQNESFSNKS